MKSNETENVSVQIPASLFQHYRHHRVSSNFSLQLFQSISITTGVFSLCPKPIKNGSALHHDALKSSPFNLSESQWDRDFAFLILRLPFSPFIVIGNTAQMYLRTSAALKKSNVLKRLSNKVQRRLESLFFMFYSLSSNSASIVSRSNAKNF